MAQDEASVCSGLVLDGKKVGVGSITNIDSTHVLGADSAHATLHKPLHPSTRSEGFLTKGRSHDEGRTDGDELKLLILRQGSLEIPCGFLSKNLALGISTHSLSTIRVAPVAFIESPIGGLVSSSQVLD